MRCELRQILLDLNAANAEAYMDQLRSTVTVEQTTERIDHQTEAALDEIILVLKEQLRQHSGNAITLSGVEQVLEADCD